MIPIKDDLIRGLAEMLVGKRVETATVSAALELVREHFCFDSACVYEVDQKNIFHLKERCLSGTMRLREKFGTGGISPEVRACLAEESLSYLQRSSTRTPGEDALLDLFFADSLVLFSIVDENSRINGFISLARATGSAAFSSDDLKSLTTLLHMVGRYISVRVYANRLAFAQSSLESILDNTGIDIYVNDFYTHDILYANKSMAAPYGGAGNFLGKKCWKVLFPRQTGPCEFCPQKKLVDEQGFPSKIYSWDYQRPFDGSWFRVFSAAFRWVDGRLAHVVSSADITENKRNEKLIEYMANYDALTGLPNRRSLVHECERRITRAKAGDKGYLLFFDIDGFKAVNDSLGHGAGDELLILLGKFFSAIPLLKDAFYRNGGDEFVGLIDGCITASNVANLAAFIHERFKKPWRLEKGTVYCNVSIGVASYPEDGSTAEELLSKADQAMYRIKKDGGAGVCFVRDLRPKAD